LNPAPASRHLFDSRNVCVAFDGGKRINIDWHLRGALSSQFYSEWWDFGAPFRTKLKY
jgi:hypothetical protein